jgi:hypothetical protein
MRDAELAAGPLQWDTQFQVPVENIIENVCWLFWVWLCSELYLLSIQQVSAPGGQYSIVYSAMSEFSSRSIPFPRFSCLTLDHRMAHGEVMPK